MFLIRPGPLGWRGSYAAKGRVSAFEAPRLLRTLPSKNHSKNLVLTEAQAPSKNPSIWGGKKPINTKHINTFQTALVHGTIVPGRNPTRPRDKRDKTAILLWNSTENGRFVQGKGPGLSQGRAPFVPETVSVCPGHRPAQNVYVFWPILRRTYVQDFHFLLQDRPPDPRTDGKAPEFLLLERFSKGS